ncbi:Cytochrome c oxidase subunit 3 [Candidatus Hodgkinia cicadicola]|nr:Cytochrome c oxidase subunit 3 [Candidatus Hodgkinia cicadicola]
MILFSYVWAYWHYHHASKSKLHNMLYNLTGGEWPPQPPKPNRKLSVTFYKTAITLLINSTLNNNRNENLGPQIALTLLLLLTQILELYSSKPLKRMALIYYTCANSILLLLVIFTTIGLIINLLQAVLNSKLIQSKCIDTLHYWYWKSFVIAWSTMYALMFK